MKFRLDIEKLFPISLLFSSTILRRVRVCMGSFEGFKALEWSRWFGTIFMRKLFIQKFKSITFSQRLWS